jgi:diguanylate cyclase (GGDEF)-like protein/PAS domain S-box-containing protein
MTLASRMRPGRSTAWAYYLACMAVLIGAYLFVPPFKGYALVVNAVGLASILAIGGGVIANRSRARLAWGLMLVGQLLYVAGDVYTYTYPDLLGGVVGFPSGGDAIYLSVYPALFSGLLLLVRRRDPNRTDSGSVLDSLVLTVGFALLFWVFLIAPNLHASGLTPLAKFVSTAYPIGDVLLLGAVIRFAVQAGRKTPAFHLLFASTVGLLATDCAYNYALLHGTYDHQVIYDLGWLAYLTLWGAAALHPSMRELERPADVRSRLTSLRLGLLAVACLIAPGIRFVEEFHNKDLLVIIGSSAILFLLVVLRVAGLARQAERAAKREVTLREAGLSLVEAVGRANVHEEAVDSAVRIVGADAKVRLVLWGEDDAVVAASNGAGSWALPPEAIAWLRSRAQRVAAAQPTERVSAALGLGSGSTVVAGLSLPEQEQGAFVIQSPADIPFDTLEALASLASQVSLALDASSVSEERNRRRGEARFRSLVAHSSDLITVLDDQGVVTYQSPSVERLLGYPVEEIEGSHFGELLADTDRSRLDRILEVADGADAHTFECSLQHQDGRWLKFEVQHTHLLDDEHVRGIVLNSRDISERKAFEDQLAHQAFHDPVTGLANRALFADRVAHALRSTVRSGSLIAVMFIDLDDFKTINDSLGHQAGDAVLAEVAFRLDRASRPADTVARFGGDEFAVLLDGVSGSDEAAMIGDRLLAALEAPFDVDGKQVYPRASMGICMSDEDLLSQDAEELLRNADVAMYMAKRDTKGRYRLFEPAMHERVVERLELRSELQRALEEGQLEVYYQPVVRLTGGDNYGVEALLRWHHPTKGLVAPGAFIPLAEETGLIIPIGKWVLDQACHKGAEIQATHPDTIRVSVNLSVKQLQSESIVEDVASALARTKLRPSSLVLEVTETVMLADADVAVQRLHALKDLGVRIAMDDFGTGYSSLSYLSRLPVDILKMDRAFLTGQIDDNGLAAAIMAIGERLGLEVVAEGIERPDQIASLQSLGFDLGQGFLFGRPMPSHALDRHYEEADSVEQLDPNAT